jgi:cytoskeletal protein CcmA (bactofilin family)
VHVSRLGVRPQILHRRSREGAASGRDERGVALAVALIVAFVVVLLSTAAVSQSVNSITQSAIGGKQVSSTDAAEAGIQDVLGQMSPSPTVVDPTFVCPSTTNLSAVSGKGSSANGNFQATYSLQYSALPGSPSTALMTALQANLSGAGCNGSSQQLKGGYTYLFSSTGTTTAGVIGSKTEQSEVFVPVNAPFNVGIFAGGDLVSALNTTLVGGDTYSGDFSVCVEPTGFQGNFYSSGLHLFGGGLPSLTLPSLYVNCEVSKNLYMNNSALLAIAAGGSVGGYIYSTGPVSLAGGVTVGQDVWSSSGPVTLAASSSIAGSIYAGNGGVNLVAGSTSGSIYSTGPVILASHATVNGNIYTTGSVTVPIGATVTGHIYSTTSNPPPQPFVSQSEVSSYVSSEMVTAANAVNGTPTGSTTTVTEPSLTFSQSAWLANTSFCGTQTTCTTSNTNFVTDNDCTTGTGFLGSGPLDPNSVWAAVMKTETSTTPTVIQTDCQFTWGDYTSLKGAGLALDANLAIFDTAGFTLKTGFAGFSSGNSQAHQLFLIVPSTPGANTLPVINDLLPFGGFPNGEASCSLLTGPDIDIQSSLLDTDSNINTFLYTPARICSTAVGAAVQLNGRLYAGEGFDTLSNWNQTYENISPAPAFGYSGGITCPAAGTSACPNVEYIRQASNPAGTT